MAQSDINLSAHGGHSPAVHHAARDELAAELAKMDPEVEWRLSDLIVRIAANDREVFRINSGRLPDGEKRLLSAELFARGLGGFVRNGVQTPSMVEELRLPRFQYDAFQ